MAYTATRLNCVVNSACKQLTLLTVARGLFETHVKGKTSVGVRTNTFCPFPEGHISIIRKINDKTNSQLHQRELRKSISNVGSSSNKRLTVGNAKLAQCDNKASLCMNNDQQSTNVTSTQQAPSQAATCRSDNNLHVSGDLLINNINNIRQEGDRKQRRFVSKPASSGNQPKIIGLDPGTDVVIDVLYGISPCLLALEGKRRIVHKVYVSPSFMKSTRPEVCQIINKIKEKELIDVVQETQRTNLDRITRGRPHQLPPHDGGSVVCLLVVNPKTLKKIKDGMSECFRISAEMQLWTPRNFPKFLHRKIYFPEADILCLENVFAVISKCGKLLWLHVFPDDFRKGICLETSRIYFQTLTDDSTEAEQTQVQPVHLVLDQIKDPMNLGAILRSAYYLGVDRVIASRHNCCSLTPVVSKASSGVMEIMPVYASTDVLSFLQKQRENGWEIVGSTSVSSHNASSSQDSKIMAAEDFTLCKPTTLVIGSEGCGLSDGIEDMCSLLLTIPAGRKLHSGIDSLNVSVATGILLQSLLQGRQ